MLLAKYVVKKRKKKISQSLSVFQFIVLTVFTWRYKAVLKQIGMNTYLKKVVSVISLDYQNMGNEGGGYDIKHI